MTYSFDFGLILVPFLTSYRVIPEYVHIIARGAPNHRVNRPVKHHGKRRTRTHSVKALHSVRVDLELRFNPLSRRNCRDMVYCLVWNDAQCPVFSIHSCTRHVMSKLLKKESPVAWENRLSSGIDEKP